MNTTENRYLESKPLQSRIAVVARGSGRTGRAVAEKLAEAGAKVVIADINLINAEVVVQAIANKYRSEAIAVAINSHGLQSVLSAFSSLKREWSEFKIWINAGCLFDQDELMNASSAQRRELVDKNMKEVFLGCRQVAEYMSASNTEGIIVNIIPVNEYRFIDSTMQGAQTNEYIASVTRALADELATKGIRVFTVSPVTGWNNPTDAEEEVNQVNGESTEHIARSVLFCITILSRTMTGSTVRVKGDEILINSMH